MAILDIGRFFFFSYSSEIGLSMLQCVEALISLVDRMIKAALELLVNGSSSVLGK
jgi:hypothetical protein